MYGLRVALWCLAGGFFCLFFATLEYRSVPLSALAFVIGIVVLGSAEVHADRRKKRNKFAHAFASYEDFSRSVDRAELRRIREAHGTAVAVRELRRQHPSVSLSTAAKLVKEL
jgi:hypothetical protein